MIPRRLLGLLLLCFFTLAGTSGRAQDEDLAEEEDDGYYADDAYDDEPAALPALVKAQLAEATVRLELTDEQTPAVGDLLLAYHEDHTAEPPADDGEERTRRRALHTSVNNLLTPGQRQLLRDWTGEHPAASPGKPKKRKWFDVLIDDVAAPILDKRRKKRGGDG